MLGQSLRMKKKNERTPLWGIHVLLTPLCNTLSFCGGIIKDVHVQYSLKLRLTFSRLFTGSEWLQLLPIVGTLSLLAYVTFQAFKSKPVPKDARVNLRIQKESSKVVNMVDIEELGDKVSYCRCWRSKRVGIIQKSTEMYSLLVLFVLFICSKK